MEVFICFSNTEPLQLVEATMQAWEQIEWADPVHVVMVPIEDFQIKRRVLADQMATESTYLLTDIGCVPEDKRALIALSARLSSGDGLIGLMPISEAEQSRIPAGIRLCRKGVVKAWPEQLTVDYNTEHAQVVKAAGKTVGVWDIPFKRLQVC